MVHRGSDVRVRLLVTVARGVAILMSKVARDLSFPGAGLANLHRPNNQITAVMLAHRFGDFLLVTLQCS
jgi:hypothetical protein